MGGEACCEMPSKHAAALARAPAGLLGALGWGVWESPFWLLLGREGVWGRGWRGRWGVVQGLRGHAHILLTQAGLGCGTFNSVGLASWWITQPRRFLTLQRVAWPTPRLAPPPQGSQPVFTCRLALPHRPPHCTPGVHRWSRGRVPLTTGLCVLFPGLFLSTMTEGKGAAEGLG